jgi:hypothetical protein
LSDLHFARDRHGSFGSIFVKLKHTTMKKNMGTADRIIRVIIAAVITTLYFTNILTGTLGIVLLILGGIFVLTSIFSFCPLYAPFGLKTKSMKEQSPAASKV